MHGNKPVHVSKYMNQRNAKVIFHKCSYMFLLNTMLTHHLLGCKIIKMLARGRKGQKDQSPQRMGASSSNRRGWLCPARCILAHWTTNKNTEIYSFLNHNISYWNLSVQTFFSEPNCPLLSPVYTMFKTCPSPFVTHSTSLRASCFVLRAMCGEDVLNSIRWVRGQWIARSVLDTPGFTCT